MERQAALVIRDLLQDAAEWGTVLVGSLRIECGSRERDRTLDRVLELANMARPVV